MPHNIGDTVSWNAVSRVETGKITGIHRVEYVVSLPDGKSVIVDEKSILKPNQ
jgi:hypothetical protein